MKPRIVVRVDANAKIGLGHLTRCLALADMVKDGYGIDIVIQSTSDSILTKCMEATDDVSIIPETDDYLIDAENLLSYLEGRDPAIVLLDGYHFNTAYQRKIKDAGHKLVCIDDEAKIHFVADAIINHNPGIAPAAYSAEPYTKIYIGFDYALLRSEFLAEAQSARVFPTDPVAFICIGGADPLNMTEKAVDACLRSLSFTKLNVVIGGAYMHADLLRQKFENTEIPVHFYHNIDAAKMVTLMQESRLAIAPSSSIALEICCVGLNLVTGYYVENQRSISSYFKEHDLGMVMGDLQNISIEQLSSATQTETGKAHYLRQKECMRGNSATKIRAIFDSLNVH